MKFIIERKDLSGEIVLSRSPVTARVSVTQNGKELHRLKEKNGPFEVSMKDGTSSRLLVKARWLDPVPVVFLEQESILLAEPLRFIDYLFGCFPIVMFLPYGVLSTLIGFFLLMGNFRILRTKMQPIVKWAAIYAMDIVSFWLVLAIVRFALFTGRPGT